MRKLDMKEAFIYDHVRTPRGRGRADGALHEIASVQLLAQVLRALPARSGFDTQMIDDVIAGCAQPVGEQGGNIARAAVLVADYAQTVAGQQVHRFCASALEAVNAAAAQVMVGAARSVIAGGVESMSRTPMGADSGAWSADPWVAYHNYFAPQGIGADLIATIDGLSRDDVDSYAVESQRRAAAAWASGKFGKSVLPVTDTLGGTILEQDELVRPDTSLETLAKLKPSFVELGRAGFDAVAIQRYPQVESINHVHHAGNSSGVADGAAAVLIGNRAFGSDLGLKRRARIRGFASIGSEPTIMLTAPAMVTEKVLRQCGMSITDVDLFEVNEAFASVVLHFQRELDVAPDIVNVNGGAIAMGHPLGASGAMILGVLLDELERRDLSVGLATLCAGNGLGTATIIERL